MSTPDTNLSFSPPPPPKYEPSPPNGETIARDGNTSPEEKGVAFGMSDSAPLTVLKIMHGEMPRRSSERTSPRHTKEQTFSRRSFEQKSPTRQSKTHVLGPPISIEFVTDSKDHKLVANVQERGKITPRRMRRRGRSRSSDDPITTNSKNHGRGRSLGFVQEHKRHSYAMRPRVVVSRKKQILPRGSPHLTKADSIPDAELTFGNQLPHQFQVAIQQVENGTYAVKRMRSFFSKFSKLHVDFAKQIETLVAYEQAKLTSSPDGMNCTKTSVLEILDNINQIGQIYREFSEDLETAVVEPLSKVYESAITTRQTCVDEEVEITNRLQSIRPSLTKAKAQCSKFIQILEDVGDFNTNSQPESTPVASNHDIRIPSGHTRSKSGNMKRVLLKRSTMKTNETYDPPSPPKSVTHKRQRSSSPKRPNHSRKISAMSVARKMKMLRSPSMTGYSTPKADDVKKKKKKHNNMFHIKPKRNFSTEKLNKIRRKSLRACQRYEHAVQTANIYKQQYEHQELPALLSKLQNVEELRINSIKTQINCFAKTTSTMSESVEDVCSKLSGISSSLDPSKDLRQFVKTCVAQYNIPIFEPDFYYDVSRTPDDVAANIPSNSDDESKKKVHSRKTSEYDEDSDEFLNLFSDNIYDQVSLKQNLKDLDFLRHFRVYLIEAFCEENLLFYLAAEHYARQEDASDDARKELAEELYKSFIHPDSPNRVNLSFNVVMEIDEGVQEPESLPDPRSLFVRAQESAFRLMNTDSYPKFKRSKQFHELLLLQSTKSENK